ncbi:homeobox domain containing protein [Acanthamoeba castellanii str. Neff]|uniref:Homeobox domain containing protein n=1 Tax=Acanthamoeba castellanii (strain ATCC 30010 / Neff) TaxID=1257118 RepID=L8HGX4_ACACF|nr:homeobox domain containing protein [Acanthamoeba castellanii str. Neff]ELR23676.1 homeobox domain containing protein [Acanthamoeba castellanii str. Neff]
MRFNQLVELTSALSEADKDTKEKVETAEILSLLGFAGGSRKNESTAATQTTQQPTGRPAAAAITRSIPQQQQLPLPSIQHIAVQPQVVAQQPRQQQQAIRPAVAKLPIKPVAVPVLPAAATATKSAATTTATRAGARSATHGVEGERKRKRSKTTPEQLRILMDEFQREPMPNATTRQTLAARLDMTPRSVQIWFQNMRAKVKKANSGSAPGDEKKSSSGSTTSPSLADTESDGPAKKRQRTVTGEEDNSSDKMTIEQQPQSRRNSVTGPSPSSTPVAIPAPQSSAALNAKTAQQQQPIKIAVSPQTSAFAPANAASLAKPRSAETTTGKLPLPVIQHHPHLGQPIFGVPLQYIPQSYHCDQLKRATMAALSGSVQHQMTA